MPKMIDLPNGEWAQLHTSDEVPEKGRRAHLKAQGAMLEGAGIKYDDDGKPIGLEGGARASLIADMGEVKDALILAYTKEWSFKLTLDANALGELPAKTYDALHEACEEQSQDALLDVSPEQALNPESPTVPLAG